MVKYVIIVSEDNEIYESLRRSFSYIAKIKAISYKGKFNGRQAVVIFVMNNDEIDCWLWSKFRKKALNPLLVIGIEDKPHFTNRNPVFADYSKQHAYIQIPFDLTELLKAINELKPIYDQASRRVIFNAYSTGYEHKLITHDLKIIKGDIDTTITNLVKVKSFYESKGNSNTSKIIDQKISEMRLLENWEETAFWIKKYLEEGLKNKGK